MAPLIRFFLKVCDVFRVWTYGSRPCKRYQNGPPVVGLEFRVLPKITQTAGWFLLWSNPSEDVPNAVREASIDMASAIGLWQICQFKDRR